MKSGENLGKWVWVVIPVVIMLLFEKLILVTLQLVYEDNINPKIFFYLPFLSLLPPLVLFFIWYWQQNKNVALKLVIAHKGKVAGDFFIGVGLGIIAIFIFLGSFALLRTLSFTIPDFSSFTIAHHLFFSTFGAVVPGIAEEIYFRGFLSRKLSNLKPALIIIITALAFSSWHILSPPYLLHTFLIGVAFGIAYYRTKRVLPVIIAHSLANMSVGILILNGYV